MSYRIFVRSDNDQIVNNFIQTKVQPCTNQGTNQGTNLFKDWIFLPCSIPVPPSDAQEDDPHADGHDP